MANIFRRIQVIFDRSSAKRAEQQLESSMAQGGKKAGQAFVRELREAFDKRMAGLKVQLARGVIDQKEFKKQADQAARTFNAGIIKGMREAHKAGNLTDKEFIKLSRTLKRVGDDGVLSGNRISGAFARLGVTLAATFTVDRAIRFFKDSITAALEAEESVSRLNSALKPLGLNYKLVGVQVERFLDNIQATTKFSDEDAREALTALVTGTGDYEKSLRLLDVTAKIAEKRQITMAEAAKVAIKASQGLNRGLTDLGISAKHVGDSTEEISKNLGDIAREAGGTNAGKIKRAANLWDEFQEKIGLAVLNSDAFQDSSEGVIGRLIDMNTWVDKNAKSIGELASNIAKLVGWLAKLSLWIVNHTPNLITLSRLIDRIRGKSPAAAEEPIHTDIGEVVPGLPKLGTTRPPPPEKAEEEKLSREERAALRSREGLEHDIRVRSLQLEEQVTQDLAEEMVRRQEVLGTAAKMQFATMEEGFKRLDDLNKMLAVAGFDKTLIPQVKRTEQAIGGLLPAVNETMTAGMERVAEQSEILARLWSTPWIDAMGILENEVEGQGTLFAELGQAWAEGGFAGLAALAAAKVKENVARIIEEGAKAIGAIALGNPKAAAEHAAAAAKHGLAVVAWKAAGAAAGGTTGGASSAGGSAGSTSTSSASNLERPESAINIYLTGPGWNALNPEVQKVVHQAGEYARERYGSNSQVRIIRGSR